MKSLYFIEFIENNKIFELSYKLKYKKIIKIFLIRFIVVCWL